MSAENVTKEFKDRLQCSLLAITGSADMTIEEFCCNFKKDWYKDPAAYATEFGFSSLKQLLKALPEEVVVSGNSLKAVVKEETKACADMIDGSQTQTTRKQPKRSNRSKFSSCARPAIAFQSSSVASAPSSSYSLAFVLNSAVWSEQCDNWPETGCLTSNDSTDWSVNCDNRPTSSSFASMFGCQYSSNIYTNDDNVEDNNLSRSNPVEQRVINNGASGRRLLDERSSLTIGDDDDDDCWSDSDLGVVEASIIKDGVASPTTADDDKVSLSDDEEEDGFFDAASGYEATIYHPTVTLDRDYDSENEECDAFFTKYTFRELPQNFYRITFLLREAGGKMLYTELQKKYKDYYQRVLTNLELRTALGAGDARNTQAAFRLSPFSHIFKYEPRMDADGMVSLLLDHNNENAMDEIIWMNSAGIANGRSSVMINASNDSTSVKSASFSSNASSAVSVHRPAKNAFAGGQKRDVLRPLENRTANYLPSATRINELFRIFEEANTPLAREEYCVKRQHQSSNLLFDQ